MSDKAFTKLVSMANQIGSYFKIHPEDEAATGIAQHIEMYWTPRMRRDICAYAEAGGAELTPLVRSAVAKLRTEPVPVETNFPG